MFQKNNNQQKIQFQCKQHDQQQIIVWCCQTYCKEEKFCCALCLIERKHFTHLEHVDDIDSLVKYIADSQQKTFELKQLVQHQSEEFCKVILQMMEGIENKFQRVYLENLSSQESICDAIQFFNQFETIYDNIQRHFDKKQKEPQLEQFIEETQLNIQNSEKYQKLGDGLLKQNSLDEAKIFYQKSLNLNKKNLDAKIGIAQCLHKSHNYNEALKLYKELQNDDKNNYFISLQIAECLRNIWQNEEALAGYSQALELQKNTYCFFMQGVILINLNREDEINNYYQEAKEFGIKDQWMQLLEILKLFIDKRKDQAKELVLSMGNVSDEQINFWIIFVKMLLSRKDEEESLKYGNQILKIEPNNLLAFLMKFYILIKQNQLEELIILFDQIQKINKNHEIIKDFQQQLYSQLLKLDYNEQMDIYELILQFNPKSITTLKLKCQCLINENKLKLALYTLQQILKLDIDEEILQMKVSLQLKFSKEFGDNYKKMYDFKTNCLKINPTNVVILEFMYLHLIEQDNYEEALNIIQQSLQVEPNNFLHQFNLCKCLIKMDNIKEAIKQLNQMIQIQSPTAIMLEQMKELFDKIINLSSEEDNREIITEQLKKTPNDFVANILECVLILRNDEEEVEKREWLFKYIDEIFDQNYQEKLKLIQNFFDDEQDELIRERAIITKAFKQLILIINKKEQNQLIKFIKKTFYKIIKEKLGTIEQISLFSYILNIQPDNFIALEFKTLYLINNQNNNSSKIFNSQQENTNQILENIEIILNQNPHNFSLFKIKCKQLLKEHKFRETVELVNQLLFNKIEIIRFQIANKQKNPLTTIIEMIEQYFNDGFDQKSKFTELYQILQVNSENQIALRLMCITLLKEEAEPNVSDYLSKLIKFLYRLNEITFYFYNDIEDIKEQISSKLIEVSDVDEIMKTFTNNLEKLFAYPILCKILFQNDKFKEVQQIVNQMLLIDPKNVSALGLQNMCLVKQGKFIESYRQFDEFFNNFQDLDEFIILMQYGYFIDFLQNNKHSDQNLFEHLKEIQNKDPYSFIAALLSDQEKQTKMKIFKEKLKINPNNQFYQSFYDAYLMEQKKYKELIQSNISPNMLFLILFNEFDNIKITIEEEIGNDNVIEYFDKQNQNGQPNMLFEIIKSIIVIEKGNQPESLMQLQKIICFDEITLIKKYDLSYNEIFKTFSDRFLDSERKDQIETIINKNLEKDPENLVFCFLNFCIKLKFDFYW